MKNFTKYRYFDSARTMHLKISLSHLIIHLKAIKLFDFAHPFLSQSLSPDFKKKLYFLKKILTHFIPQTSDKSDNTSTNTSSDNSTL